MKEGVRDRAGDRLQVSLLGCPSALFSPRQTAGRVTGSPKVAQVVIPFSSLCKQGFHSEIKERHWGKAVGTDTMFPWHPLSASQAGRLGLWVLAAVVEEQEAATFC